MAARQHVVIIGGGFGGLYAARALRGVDVDVTLIDRKNHHTFQPLLYQVATAGLNPSDIAVPIRRILRRQKNVRVLLAEAESVEVDGQRVRLSGGGTLEYDHLIIATGATHSYFAHPEWEKIAPGLKTIEDALEMRKRVFFAFEAAEREEDRDRYRDWLTFVIVGAGPTGVELAGTLAEISKKTLAKDFRRIDPTSARILLLEGAPNLLGAYVPELRDKAKAQLEGLGVEVKLDTLVTAIDENGVTLKDGEKIASKTVLWAAGVAASPLVKSLGVPLDRAGRVIVGDDMTIPGHPEVQVIGDTAAHLQDGKPIPGVARAAIDGGKHAAKNIERALAGQPPVAFVYADPGMLATIGRGAGIAQLGKVKISGFMAWLAWLLIHILFLIGFRNRFAVILEWAAAYLTYDRGARLITGKLPDMGTRVIAAPTSRRGGAVRSAQAPPVT